MKNLGRIVLIGVLLLVIVIVAGGIYIYRQLDQETIELGRTEGELVFMSDRDGDWDIFLLDKEGELHNLTADSAGDEYYPNFTFNGEQVSLFSNVTGDITPARVNVDGTDFKTQTNMIAVFQEILASGNTDWDPVWSPGGDRLAWDKVIPGLPPRVDMFVANADSSDPVQITEDGATEFMHNWSPDGTQLVYTSNADGKQNVYVVDLADNTVTRLTEFDVNNTYQPAWSRDGAQILFIYSESASMIEGQIEFQVINADGSDLHSLVEGEVFEGEMVYSPYSGQVAYMSNESGYWHIYVMDADGSNVKPLTEGDHNNLFPAWRPVPADQQAEAETESE